MRLGVGEFCFIFFISKNKNLGKIILLFDYLLVFLQQLLIINGSDGKLICNIYVELIDKC